MKDVIYKCFQINTFMSVQFLFRLNLELGKKRELVILSFSPRNFEHNFSKCITGCHPILLMLHFDMFIIHHKNLNMI